MEIVTSTFLSVLIFIVFAALIGKLNLFYLFIPSHQAGIPLPPFYREKFYYVMALGLFPILIYSAHYVLQQKPFLSERFRKLLSNKKSEYALNLFLIFFLVLINFNNGFFYLRDSPFLNPYYGIFFFAFASFLFFNLNSILNLNLILNLILRGLTALCLIVFWVLRVGDLDWGFAFRNSNPEFSPWIDFNVVFHGFSQVQMGRVPLVDFFSQYGNFSFLLSPVFLIFPLTLFSFTFLMALLSVCSFFFLYLALSEWIDDKNICWLTLLATLYCIFFINPVVYLANIPIRLFFPSLVFWTASKHFKEQKPLLLWMSIALSCLAVFWNFDTGFVLLVSLIGAVCFKSLLQSGFKKGGREVFFNFSFSLVLLALTFLLYAGGAFILTGTLPVFPEMFRFYGYYVVESALGMPLPSLHPWSLVFIFYLCSLSYCFRGFFIKRAEIGRTAFVFFLTIFGMGIFSYYIMRSCDQCLLAVSYPAILLEGLSLNRRSEFTWLTRYKTLGLIVLALSTFSSSKITTQVQRIKESPVASHTRTKTAFLSALPSTKEVTFLSDYSGILHLLSKTYCPLKIPSASEMLQKDVLTLHKYLTNPSSVQKTIVLDKEFFMYRYSLWDPIRNLLKSKVPIATSLDGTMLLYFL
jgi:hypothetical protein